MAKDLAIVLNDGGINSAVVTALAAQKYRPVLVHAEASDGGSRGRAAFDQQVAHFKPYREHALALPFPPAGGGAPASATGPGGPDPRQQAPLGPRLLELLPLVALAARFAGQYRATALYFGLRVGGHVDDLARATEYVQIWRDMIEMPCGQPDVDVQAPLLELEPWQVVDLAFNVAAPLERTWSCLGDGGEPCWACPACRAREAAFQQAGKPDPLRLRKA